MEIRLDRPLALAEDNTTVVEEHDSRARYVLGGKGSTVNTPTLERLGLRYHGRTVVYPGHPNHGADAPPFEEEAAEETTVDETTSETCTEEPAPETTPPPKRRAHR